MDEAEIEAKRPKVQDFLDQMYAMTEHLIHGHGLSREQVSSALLADRVLPTVLHGRLYPTCPER